jgi:hypothetical protein
VRDPGQRPQISGQGGLERTREHGLVFFALYRQASDLVFRAGARQWSLARSDLRFEFSQLRPARSRFRVFEGTSETFQCTYGHILRSIAAQMDVTYDNLDFENDHFLAFVASLRLPATLANFPGWQGWLDGVEGRR